jgi:hypothetical protein
MGGLISRRAENSLSKGYSLAARRRMADRNEGVLGETSCSFEGIPSLKVG